MTPFPAKMSGCDASSTRRAAAWRAGRSGDGRLARHVLGHLDVAGAGLLGLRELEGLADHLGNHGRRLQARVPLRQWPQVLDDVDVLVGLLVDAVPGGLARDGHEGGAVEVGVGYARGEV